MTNKEIISRAMLILDNVGIDDYPGGCIIDNLPVLIFDSKEDTKEAASILLKNSDIKATLRRDNSVTLWLDSEEMRQRRNRLKIINHVLNE